MGSLRSLARPPIKTKRAAEESVAARVTKKEFIVIVEHVPICMGVATDFRHVSSMPMSEDNWTLATTNAVQAKQRGETWTCLRLMAESEGLAIYTAPRLLKHHFWLKKEYEELKELHWFWRVLYGKKRKERMKQLEEVFSKPLDEDILRV
jgi:hypothetical protein